MKMEQMYQEVILDHYKHPHHRGLREPFGAEVGCEVRAENLDRDATMVLQVLGDIDGRHAAGPKFALDSVFAGERNFKASRRISQATLRCAERNRS